MSTLHKVIEIEYKNRKPSKAVIMRTIGEYLKQGGKAFSITWGENWIDLTYHDRYHNWYGEGWIKDIGGDDIAKELNSIRKQAIKQVQEDLLNDYNYVGSRHHY